MSIYITGDVHGHLGASRFNTANFPAQKTMTRNDVVIVLGDFGLVWNNNKTYQHWLKWYAEKPFTLVFIDGNHDNHDWLREFPEKQWHGGRVHVIADNVLHLMRGELFTIAGQTWFAFGGALSVDKEHRQVGVSWWPGELPSVAECEHGLATLDNVNWHVDHVLTHTAPVSVLDAMFPQYVLETDITSNYLEMVHDQLTFTHWWYGHWHVNLDHVNGDKAYHCLFEEIRQVI